VTSFVVWFILKATLGIRVSEEEDYEGVDIGECGLEAYPEFLVLTEDDHLDFLAAVAGGQGVIPLRVQRALSSFAIILLGYHLHDWDFKVIFRGLVIPNDMGNRPRSVAIQLSPEDQAERVYLAHYLAQEAQFKVDWCDTGPFVEELWDAWAGEPGAADVVAAS